MRAGLVEGEAFAIDASVIEADASHNRKVDGGGEGHGGRANTLQRLIRRWRLKRRRLLHERDDEPPGNRPSEPKVTSLTDPAAAWTSEGRMKVAFAYGINYLIDTAAAIIIDVAATPARWSAEVAATKTMLERVKEHFGLQPQRLAEDAAYELGFDDQLADATRHRATHTPAGPRTADQRPLHAVGIQLRRPSKRVHLPERKATDSGKARDDGTISYWASTKDCRTCPLKSRCTTGEKRIVTRNVFEAARERVRALLGTPAFERSAMERKKIEMRFAHLKRHLSFRRLRLRGITGASDEFLLAAAAQNVRRLASCLTEGWGMPSAQTV